MFVKLFKYEFRHNAVLNLILAAVALGLAVVAGVGFGAMTELMTNMAEYSVSVEDALLMLFAELGLQLLYYVCVLGISGFVIAVMGMNIWRFYKHKFTDEGYLTFTLPVKTSHLWWSSFLSNLLWQLIAYGVVWVCGSVVAAIYLAWIVPLSDWKDFFNFFAQLKWEDWQMFFQGLEEIFGWFKDVPGLGLYLFLSSLVWPLALLVTVTLPMTCVTVGSVLVKRCKLLLSIGIYVVVTEILGALAYCAMVVPLLATIASMEYFFLWMSLYMLLVLGLYAAVVVGGNWLSLHLMKKKLNLP